MEGQPLLWSLFKAGLGEMGRTSASLLTSPLQPFYPGGATEIIGIKVTKRTKTSLPIQVCRLLHTGEYPRPKATPPPLLCLAALATGGPRRPDVVDAVLVQAEAVGAVRPVHQQLDVLADAAKGTESVGRGVPQSLG